MIKVKTVKKKSDNSEILKLFNQLTGVEDPDPVVVESKYENFMYHSENIIKAWTVFCKSPFAQLIKNDLPERFKEIVNFVVESKKFLSEMSIPVSDNKFKTNSFSDSILDDFKEILIKYDPQLLVKNYKTIKNSILRVHITNTLANISNLLADDNKRNNKILDCLCDKNNLSNTFITQTALDTKLLSFSILDFQYLYNIYGDRIGEFDNLILIVLRVTYCSALEIKKLIFSPDINIAEFVQAFGKRLDETSKEIPGCDRAFKCLKKSLWMLEKNFGTYYDEYMATNNPGVIFENFIMDVSKNLKKGAVTMQFSKITEYLKKRMPEKHKNDPMVNKLFGVSDKIFEQMREQKYQQED